jgi:hypothetical protein
MSTRIAITLARRVGGVLRASSRAHFRIAVTDSQRVTDRRVLSALALARERERDQRLVARRSHR